MALPLLATLLCVLAELFYLRVRKGERIPWRDMVLNLNSGHILMWLFRGVEIAIYAWVLAQLDAHWLDGWPPIAVWMLALLAWDLGFYWMHRTHHLVPLLWSVHVVHHEGEHFNLSLGIRNAWLSSLTTLPFTTIPLALLGVPLHVFVVVSTIHYTVQLYNHNAIVGHSGWLERFLITPSHHRVHHGQNAQYRDRNFGGTLLLWDRLFRSFQPELSDVPVKFGVRHRTASTNPFWANVAPLLRYAGLAAKGPAAPARPSLVPELAIGTGGIVLFCIVAYYIHRIGTWPAGGQPLLFALILASTFALGGMSDERHWGLPCWIGLGCLGLVAMPLAFGLRDWMGWLALAAQPIHGLATAVVMRKRTTITSTETP